MVKFEEMKQKLEELAGKVSEESNEVEIWQGIQENILNCVTLEELDNQIYMIIPSTIQEMKHEIKLLEDFREKASARFLRTLTTLIADKKESEKTSACKNINKKEKRK